MNLQDVFVIENLTILNEGKSGSGPLKIRGIFQRADEANHNNRIYPRKVLENQVSHLANAIVERRLVGELDHPTYEMVKLSNASHLITGLRLQGNEVIGEAEILPTPAGKVVEGLIRGGVKIGISSRGMGTLSEGRNGTKTVNEDFKLVTFDIVADPSTRGAFPTLSESRELKKDKKIIESTIKSVVGERYFLKLLEKRIDEMLNEGDGTEGGNDDDEEEQSAEDIARSKDRLPPELEPETTSKPEPKTNPKTKPKPKPKEAKMDTASVILSKKQGQSEILEGNRKGKPKQGPKPVSKFRPKGAASVKGGEVIYNPDTQQDEYKPFIPSKRSRAENETNRRRAERANKK